MLAELLSYSKVTELVLDNCRSSNGEIEGLNDSFKELEFLSMAKVELTSLAKLPTLSKLRKVRASRSPVCGEVKVRGATHAWVVLMALRGMVGPVRSAFASGP